MALVQSRASLRDIEKNLDKIADVIGSTDADLCVFPEMFLTGYSLRDEVFTMAEPLDGRSVSRLIEIAADSGTAILAGMPIHADERGQIHNSAVFISPDGTVDVYHKRHIINFGPFEETYFFRAGERMMTFEIGDMTFGVIVCYDVFFPELVKAYAIKGVDAVIVLSASPSVTRIYFERILPARAIENTIYMLFTNLVGTEKSLVFWGGAQVHDPRGNRMERGPYFEEAVVTVDLDPAVVRTSRPFRTTLSDTDAGFIEFAGKL